jgi:hypothetical protein
MPKVPVSQRQVAERIGAAPQFAAPAGVGAFGGFEAEAIEQIGRGVTALGEEAQRVKIAEEKIQATFKERKDKLWADEQTIVLNNRIRGLRAGYLTDPNTDGLGVRHQKDLEKVKTEILNTTTDEQQKAFFLSNYNAKATVALNAASTYEVNKFKEREANTLIAINENAVRAAAEAAPLIGSQEGDLALMDSRNDLENVMERQTEGMTASQKKNFKAEGRSAYHLAVLNSLVPVSATKAQDYYNKNKKEIVPENRQAVEDVLTVEDTLQSAQEATDEIMAIESDPAERMRLAREFKHTGTEEEQAKKRKETESQVKTRNTELKQLEKEVELDTLYTALEAINLAPNKDAGDLIAKRLPEPHQTQALAHSESRFKRKTEDVITDRTVQVQVYEDIDNRKITGVRQLLPFQSKLSETDYNRVITELRRKTGKGQDVEKTIKWSTMKEAFSTAMVEKYDVEDEDQNDQIMFAYDKIVESGITGHHEATKFIQNLLIDGSVRGRLWDSTLSRPEAEAEGKLHQWLPDLLEVEDDNGAERRNIDAAFRSRGIRTKNETLMRLYKKDAILKLKLTESEKAEYRRLVSQEGVVHPVRR